MKEFSDAWLTKGRVSDIKPSVTEDSSDRPTSDNDFELDIDFPEIDEDIEEWAASLGLSIAV